MPTIIQPVFEIPPEIMDGLITEIYRRVGGVIYHAAGITMSELIC